MNALNVACGVYYINDSNWINVDWEANSSEVVQQNLLSPLNFNDNSFDFIYCSHFIEHIPAESANRFLSECNRLLRRNGVIRLVTPDFEKTCQEYLSQSRLGLKLNAEYVKFALIDQLVRTKPGGNVQLWRARASSNLELREFINHWTGYFSKASHTFSAIEPAAVGNRQSLTKNFFVPRLIKRRLIWTYCNFIVYLLPKWFRQQHVSLCRPGEKHLYIHDFSSIKSILEDSGFHDVTRVSASTTNSGRTDFLALDLDEAGKPRKGAESMYIEARAV
jgi:SAM-dependent methyltransferase